MIIDTHCHISDRWYEPGETLLFQMDRCGVDRAWLIQLLGSYENSYQQAWRARHPDRLISIVGVDWTREDAIGLLPGLVNGGAAGIRLRPTSRSPGPDPLAIWRVAADAGLVISCVGTAAQFCDPAFATVLDEVSRLRVVLEHLGGLARPDVGDLAGATPQVAALARFPQLGVKLPGLGQLVARAGLSGPCPADGAPVADEPTVAAMLASFGPARMMWASDYPVVSTREGYASALSWMRAVIAPADRALVFGLAAQAWVDGKEPFGG